MAIQLLKTLVSRLRKEPASAGPSGSKTSSSSRPADKNSGNRRGPRNAKRGSGSTSGDSGSGEVWRPGKPGASTPKSKKAESSSAQRSQQKRRRGSGKPRRPHPLDDSNILSQPDDETTAPPEQINSTTRQPESKEPVNSEAEPVKESVAAEAEPVKESVAAEAEPVKETEAPATPKSEGPKPERRPKEPAKPWTLDDFKVEAVEGKTRFHDVGLPDEILHSLSDMGFEYCTPIQARVLQEVADGHNVAGKAQTGTGKTAAFLLLTFKQFLQNPLPADRPKGRPRALVIAPTRELVIQIQRDSDEMAKHSNIRSMAVYGGTDYDKQERQLLRSPIDLIAATPGRLLDFQRKGKIDLKGVEVLIIDEADRMLDMGFIPDVRTIIRCTPAKDKRRTLLFSATLSDAVMRLAAQWMPEPHVVEIEPDQVAVDTVKQLVYMVRANQKFTVLHNLLKRPSIGRVLIFANRRDQTERIAFELQRYGIQCEVLSGAVAQNKRTRVLDDFRSGKIKTVVATDVAGRGIHVDDIDHVVNFDLPYEAEDYVHRIGRTGRAGADGTAVSFACEDESFTIPEIEKFIGEELSCKYPEDSLTKELPHTDAKHYVRPPRRGGGGGGRGGYRGGSSRGGSRGRGRR